MGIYGALSTAVTGMNAQSFALENISGNIANSQTTGYKRMETGFVDLIPDAAVGRQKPGAVLAYSRSTNDVRGDIVTSPTGTHVALNGSGFFVVAEKTGSTDGQSVFGESNYYTRRGDFEMDREGYMRNGAGYYLKGVPVDASTGNVSGSIPEMVKVGNGLIAAQQTQRIDYALNLPAVPASEVGLLANFATSTSGVDGLTAEDDLAWSAPDDDLTIAYDPDGETDTFVYGTDGTTVGELIEWVNERFTGVSAQLSDEGEVQIQSTYPDYNVTISGGAAGAAGLDMAGTVNAPTQPTGKDFVEGTVEGGAITVYAPNGASVNVQMRWGKVSNEPDTWRMFYMNQSDPQEWTQVPEGEFAFNKNGSLQSINREPAVTGEDISVTIPGLEINGTLVGDVEIDFGEDGLTQFDNANGRAKVTTLEQDGYTAGEFMSVAVNDSGRVVATYSNGKQIEIFQLVTANFNAENQLKRLDGGIYSATAESGEAILSSDGGVTGGALESSNTDISEEFTKLIVTQQAYAAGTRIVSTSDEMLQEALNMLR